MVYTFPLHLLLKQVFEMWQNIYDQTSNAPLTLKSSLKVALIPIQHNE